MVTGNRPRPIPCKPRPITRTTKLVEIAESTHPAKTTARATSITRRFRGPSARRPIAGVAKAPVSSAAVSTHRAALKRDMVGSGDRRDERCTQAGHDGNEGSNAHEDRQGRPLPQGSIAGYRGGAALTAIGGRLPQCTRPTMSRPSTWSREPARCVEVLVPHRLEWTDRVGPNWTGVDPGGLQLRQYTDRHLDTEGLDLAGEMLAELLEHSFASLEKPGGSSTGRRSLARTPRQSDRSCWYA
jgi:hypothetical protein